jgi:hypothetical protein
MFVIRLFKSNNNIKRFLSHHHAPIPHYEFCVNSNSIKTINDNILGLHNILAFHFFILNAVYVPFLLILKL